MKKREAAKALAFFREHFELCPRKNLSKLTTKEGEDNQRKKKEGEEGRAEESVLERLRVLHGRLRGTGKA